MSILANAPITVGVDGSSPSRAAILWAAREAYLHQLPLHLVHAIVPPVVGTFPETPVPTGYAQWQREQGEEYLAQAVTLIKDHPQYRDLDIATTLVAGPAVGILLEHSQHASMIVIGCRGQGLLKRTFLGSVSSALVRHSSCPTTVIHDTISPSQDAPIMVGVDGSRFCQKVLRIAFEEASLRHVDLIGLYAWYDGDITGFSGIDPTVFDAEGKALLSEQLAGFQENYPDVGVKRMIVRGRPADQLVKQGQSSQLIILGSHGRGGFTGMLLGSVGAAVVHSSSVPTLIIRDATSQHGHHR